MNKFATLALTLLGLEACGSTDVHVVRTSAGRELIDSYSFEPPTLDAESANKMRLALNSLEIDSSKDVNDHALLFKERIVKQINELERDPSDPRLSKLKAQFDALPEEARMNLTWEETIGSLIEPVDTLISTAESGKVKIVKGVTRGSVSLPYLVLTEIESELHWVPAALDGPGCAPTTGTREYWFELNRNIKPGDSNSQIR